MAAGSEIVCAGGAVIDRKFALRGPLLAGTSNPADGASHFGGVARNVCETLARFGIPTALASRIGADAAGREIAGHLQNLGVDLRLLQVDPLRPTAQYIAVLAPDGGLELGLADMAIFDSFVLADALLARRPRYLFADCNLPAQALAQLAAGATAQCVFLAADCVSVAKSARFAQRLDGFSLLFANVDEAAALTGAALPAPQAALALVARGAAAAVVTLGAGGLVVAREGQATHLPPVAAAVTDVTGAGDALIATTLAGLWQGMELEQALHLGQRAAALTLAVKQSVRDDLATALGWRAQMAQREHPND